MNQNKRLAVIGLDGESWCEIERYGRIGIPDNVLFNRVYRLLAKRSKRFNSRVESYFQKLKRCFNCGILTCDCEVVHTVPSWTLAFSGLRLKEHGMANYHKPSGGFWERKDFPHPFIWNTLSKRGYECKCLDLKIFGLCYNTEVNVSVDVRLPTSFNECRANLRWAKRKVLEELESNPNLFVYTSPFPDHALHLRKQYKLTEGEYVKLRKEEERFLEGIMPVLIKQDFIIFSDHGHPYILDNIWQYEGITDIGHHREGMVITNLPNPPKRISQMYKFLMRYFDEH